MELKLWHSKKFRKDFYKYFDKYAEQENFREQRDFVMEYEQEIIDIKKTYHVLLSIFLVISFLVSLFLVNIGEYRIASALGALFLFGIWCYRYNRNQIILFGLSRDLTKQVYDEKIKEKYNL